MTSEFNTTENASDQSPENYISPGTPLSGRSQDITGAVKQPFTINVDEVPIPAFEGESVLSALLASNIRQVMRNDFGVVSGAYCGMGVCHCCSVYIDGKHKQRACQTIVRPGMQIQTQRNIVWEQVAKHER